MIRFSILAGAALALVLSTGCEKAADDQQKANAAQSEANTKIDNLRMEAEKKVKETQAAADKKIAEAQASFMKLREDYRHTMTTNLADLDKKVVDLEAKAKTANGKAKADLDANLQQIHASRAQLATDYRSLETATASTWDAAKARLDKEWTDLKALVDKS